MFFIGIYQKLHKTLNKNLNQVFLVVYVNKNNLNL